MGIQGLLPMLKSVTHTVHLREYEGMKAGVDAFTWLHKAAYTCCTELVLGKPTDKYIHSCMERVQLLQKHGVTPLFVFDGASLPAKRDLHVERRRAREENREKALALYEQGKQAQARTNFQKAVMITHEMAHELMKALRAVGVSYMVAPYEADAQLAYLSKKGIVDVILTEDSDTIPYGCRRVLFKLDKEGNAQEIESQNLSLNEEYDFEGWTDNMFLDMCLLTGCDYLASLPGIGIKTAYKLVKQHRTYKRVVQALKTLGGRDLPPNYVELFAKARLTFRHHYVYEPEEGCIVPLTPFSPAHLELDLGFLGPRHDPPMARAIAEGKVNPDTLRPYSPPSPQQQGQGQGHAHASAAGGGGGGGKEEEEEEEEEQRAMVAAAAAAEAEAGERERYQQIQPVWQHRGPTHKQAHTQVHTQGTRPQEEEEGEEEEEEEVTVSRQTFGGQRGQTFYSVRDREEDLLRAAHRESTRRTELALAATATHTRTHTHTHASMFLIQTEEDIQEVIPGAVRGSATQALARPTSSNNNNTYPPTHTHSNIRPASSFRLPPLPQNAATMPGGQQQPQHTHTHTHTQQPQQRPASKKRRSLWKFEENKKGENEEEEQDEEEDEEAEAKPTHTQTHSSHFRRPLGPPNQVQPAHARAHTHTHTDSLANAQAIFQQAEERLQQAAATSTRTHTHTHTQKKRASNGGGDAAAGEYGHGGGGRDSNTHTHTHTHTSFDQKPPMRARDFRSAIVSDEVTTLYRRKKQRGIGIDSVTATAARGNTHTHTHMGGGGGDGGGEEWHTQRYTHTDTPYQGDEEDDDGGGGGGFLLPNSSSLLLASMGGGGRASSPPRPPLARLPHTHTHTHTQEQVEFIPAFSNRFSPPRGGNVHRHTHTHTTYPHTHTGGVLRPPSPPSFIDAPLRVGRERERERERKSSNSSSFSSFLPFSFGGGGRTVREPVDDDERLPPYQYTHTHAHTHTTRPAWASFTTNGADPHTHTYTHTVPVAPPFASVSPPRMPPPSPREGPFNTHTHTHTHTDGGGGDGGGGGGGGFFSSMSNMFSFVPRFGFLSRRGEAELRE